MYSEVSAKKKIILSFATNAFALLFVNSHVFEKISVIFCCFNVLFGSGIFKAYSEMS